MFTNEDIKSYANKLLIDLSEEETQKLTSEFDYIKKSADLINEIPNINEVAPMHMISYVGDIVLRSDEEQPSLTKKEILKNCDSIKEESVCVPKVVE